MPDPTAAERAVAEGDAYELRIRGRGDGAESGWVGVAICVWGIGDGRDQYTVGESHDRALRSGSMKWISLMIARRIAGRHRQSRDDAVSRC